MVGMAYEPQAKRPGVDTQTSAFRLTSGFQLGHTDPRIAERAADRLVGLALAMCRDGPPKDLADPGRCFCSSNTSPSERRMHGHGSTASKSSRIQTYRGSKPWDYPSAGPSLNRAAAACGLPATLRTAQAFTSPCPPQWSPGNDT